ncbi:MAG: 5'-nucleotidase C-terminal domain-containing protein, partial [Owenweeksia sp.]
MKKLIQSALALLAGTSLMYSQTTFSKRVNSSTDDAEEEAISGTMYDNSSDLELVFDNFVNDNQLIGMRFTNVTIPHGAIVTKAYIQFEVDETKAADPCNLLVFMEDNLNPSTYTAASNNISGRSYLNDSIAWNPPTWVAVNDQGPAQQTSDLSKLVQHTLNNPNWMSGNSMAFMIKGTGTRTAESFDGEATAAPQLNIHYIMPANFSTRVGNSNDDAEESKSNGAMDLTSSDLELVVDGSDDQYVGMRFDNINVPAGAYISSAYIQFQVDELKAANPCNLKIFVEDNTSPAPYSSMANNISSRAYLNDSVMWSPPTWSNVGDQGPDQRTADISWLVQKMVNKSAWSTGSDLAFMIEGTGIRTAESYDGDMVNAPQLVVNFIPVDYTLQVLHASDLEGGVEAIEDAPNFAAIIDKLEDDYMNSVTISSGDNYIPGPFFNAASEPPIQDSLRDILSDFYGTSLNALTTARGRIDISLMNVMGFDAATFGNHEFDAGTTAISDIIFGDGNSSTLFWMGAQFPYLSSNLNFSASNLSSRAVNNIRPAADFVTDVFNPGTVVNTPKIAPATTIMRNGEMIGVVGATTQLLATISSPGSVSVVGTPTSNNMVQLAGVLQPYIDSLTNLGIDKIIVSTHLQQFALEQQLAGLLNNVDIIIAGGSDYLLADNTDALRPGDVAAGPYPFVSSNANGDPLLIVSTDGQYSYVGRLVVGFDANGVLLPFTVNENVSGAYATIPSVVSNLYGSSDPFTTGSRGYYAERLTNSIKDIVIAKDGNIFGKTNHFLEGRREYVRTEETNMGDLTADANLWVARQYDPTVAVSLKNGGGIRAEIGVIDQQTGQLLPPAPNTIAGKDSLEISQLDIENTLRFNNGLKVVDTDPTGLKALLEHGISNWNGVSTNGQMPQVGGIRFSFDPTQPAGSRIRNMAIVDGIGNVTDSIVVNGTINGNPTRTIKMVSLNFLVDNDGDGYPFSTATSNGVDLNSSNLPATGVANFASAGSEQDAMAEFLANYFTTNPYDTADTPPALDTRIQILSLRNDEVYGKANYTLQLLHASDLEGGVDAIEDAPNFAALVDKLEDDYANTVIISSGDNWIPGPFFNAAAEPPIQDSLRNILSDFYGVNLNSLTTARGRIDISLMNVIGFDASAFGNHEFDATVTAVQEIILSSGTATDLSWMGAQFPYL